MNKIIESLRDDLTALQKIGVIRAVTLREFEAIGASSVPESDADAIPDDDRQNPPQHHP